MRIIFLYKIAMCLHVFQPFEMIFGTESLMRFIVDLARVFDEFLRLKGICFSSLGPPTLRLFIQCHVLQRNGVCAL